jgi:hypothetical protein
MLVSQSGNVIIVLIQFKCKMKDYSTLASHMVDMILQQVIQHITPLKNDTLNYPPWNINMSIKRKKNFEDCS